jgi:hypothetical protein
MSGCQILNILPEPQRRRFDESAVPENRHIHDVVASTAVPLAEVSFLSPFNASELFFEAAICHAGIAARPPPNLLLPDDAELLGRSIAAAAGAVAAGVASGTAVWVPPIGPPVTGDGAVAEIPFCMTGAEGVYPIPVPLAEPVGLCVVVGLGALDPTRFPMSVFKLLSSVPSSLSLESLVSFCASSAFGIRSLKLLISSAFRLASSSLLRSEAFSEESTDSSSPSAVSSFVVLLSSATFNAVVSVFN